MKFRPDIPDEKLNQTGQWIATCPFCHKEGHFYMNSYSGEWDCKKCGKAGTFKRFLKLMKRRIERKIHRIKDHSQVKIKLKDLDKSEKTTEKKFKYEEPPTISLPVNFMEISHHTKRAFNYITNNRHYTIEDMELDQAMYCKTGMFQNRIIIPIFLHGKLKGFLGRWVPYKNKERNLYYNKKKGKVIEREKYLNSFHVDFARLLWNYDNINPKKPVIICEGYFSAKRIGVNSVASFGKKLSDDQIYLLKKKKVKEVILMFDSDALKEIDRYSMKLYEEQLYNNGITPKIFILPEGDPDDLKEENKGDLYRMILEHSEYYFPKRFALFSLKEPK